MNKNIYKTISCLLILFAGLLSFQISYAFQFDNYYFLGDSLTDQGNNPNAPHDYTNDQTWAYYFGQKVGKTTSASDDGGTNYAYAGAETNGDSMDGTGNGLQTQVDAIIAAHGHLDSSSLYSVWAGANDYLKTLAYYEQLKQSQGGQLTKEQEEAEASTLLTTSATSPGQLITELNKLHHAGAKYIVVFNLPELGETPSAHHNANLDNITKLFNANLAKDVANLSYSVIQVNIEAMFNSILRHPLLYGIHNTDDECKTQGDCSQYLFYNDVHPSSAGHRLIASLVFDTLSAPTNYATLTEAPRTVIQNQDQTITEQLEQARMLAQLGKPKFFATGDYSSALKSSIASHRDKYQSLDNKGGTVGILYPTNPWWTLGLAFGYTTNHTALNSNTFSFNLNAGTASMFADLHTDNFYVNTILNYSGFDFESIKRTTTVQTAHPHTSGSTTGDAYGVALNTAYYFNVGSVKTGPLLNTTYQHLFVQGYTEGNTNISTADRFAYKNANNQYLNTGLGWQVDIKHPMSNKILTTHLFVTGNRQWLNHQDRTIQYGYIGQLAYSAMPVAGNTKSAYVSAGGTIGLTLPCKLTLTVGYTGNFGQDSMAENFYNVGVSMPLA